MCSTSTRFDGKVIIVTGSSSGIGASAAIMFAERGGSVTLHGRREDKLKEVAQKIEEISGKKPVLVLGDITCAKVREELVNETLKVYGKIDVLVNNAGHGRLSKWDTDLSELQNLLDVHIIAPMDLSQRVMPELIKNKGNIVMVSSVAGMAGIPFALQYSIAKGGMQQMMRSLSADVAKLGVRVNSVCPGSIATDFRRSGDWERVEDMGITLPQGPPHPNERRGRPEEVAELICFVACDGASMITGSTNTADGGLTAAIMWK